jgi:hypothetical protein
MPNTLKDIVSTMKSKGYEVDTRPYALNIVGVRNSKATDQNTFDDELAYFYYDVSGVLRGRIVAGTTDPSTFYLMNPVSGATDNGTAILKSGQYKNAYRIGLHKGKYEALVQTGGKVTTIRDNDRNAYINYFAPTTSGYYGINIHRASRGKKNEAIIDYDSAGCQVFMKEADFNEMMSLARIHRDKYGNKFTYTLIDERDLLKAVNTTIMLIGLCVLIYYAYKK